MGRLFKLVPGILVVAVLLIGCISTKTGNQKQEIGPDAQLEAGATQGARITRTPTPVTGAVVSASPAELLSPVSEQRPSLTPSLTPEPEATMMPGEDTVSRALGSISGSLRSQQGICWALRVFAHEINSGQITNVRTRDGECGYTIPDLPAGDYQVVGWFYPTGVSGAYTWLETVMAVTIEEMEACEAAILTIALKPGEHVTGADIGCWGGDFFGIAAPYDRRVSPEPNRWQLTWLDGQTVAPEAGITLILEAGEFFGSAGCNNYGGKYSTDPFGSFGVDEIAKSEQVCPEPAGVMAQEERFLSVLASARSFLTVNLVLELMDEDGQTILRFELLPGFDVSPGDLAGRTWRLTAAPGIGRPDLESFTISFDWQGFWGTTTCRNYAGSYTVEKDRLRIRFLEMTTGVSCGDSLLAEGVFTALLENVEQYNISDGRLELYTLKRELLAFDAVAVQE